ALVLNLFNLTPFWILDGARMLAPVAVRDGVIGAIIVAAAMVASAVYAGALNPIGLIAAAACIGQVAIRAHRARASRQSASALDRLAAHADAAAAPSDDVPAAERRKAAVTYFATLGALGVATQLLHGALP